MKFLKYENKKKNRRIDRIICAKIINEFLKSNKSIKKLKKIKGFKVNWSADNQKQISDEINYDKILKHISENHFFDHKKFNLPEIKDTWLDGSFNIALQNHFVGSDNDPVKIIPNMSLGENFPLKPTLDREGIIFNSFQLALTSRIVDLHKKLVESSDEFSEPEWLFDFITMISACISLVDITLNHLYVKAQYDPFEGWVFDEEKLGNRINRRMKDKLKWIYCITGNPLDNIQKEMSSFKILKSIRNHTQHFDPPCFGFTLEEAATWFNMVKDVGILILEIRNRINSTLNTDLIKLILLPDVLFEGDVVFNRQRKEHKNTGYQTTIW
ncbi:MAG: hypothetical protein GY834_07420 [Bacteroidetes bacterium]|nr:hypothetical protein [Bacteroidota bacterium]